jgi:hypothetical protein
MEIVLSKARVEVDDIFELLVNEIDVKVERFFRARIRPHHDQPDPHFARINTWREACIKEIRECKDYNLSLIDMETARLPLEQRIKRFCFLIGSIMFTAFYSANQFEYTLFSTDKYLTKKEITCFETLLKFMPGAKFDRDVYPDKTDNAQGVSCVRMLLTGIEERHYNQVSLSAF